MSHGQMKGSASHYDTKTFRRLRGRQPERFTELLCSVLEVQFHAGLYRPQ